MYISDLIVELQQVRVRYGDLQVWVQTQGPGIHVVVKEMLDPKSLQPTEKVVFIE